MRQSYIAGPVMYKTVDRPSFSAIQARLFPIFFGMQTALPVVLAVTYPGNTLTGLPSGIYGLLDESSRLGSLLPVSAMFISGLINLVMLLPATQQVMKDRRGQGIPCWLALLGMQ